MFRRVCLAVLLAAIAGCQEDPPPPPPSVEKAAPVALPKVESADPTRITIHHADQLDQVDLSQVRVLDLALSPIDQLGHMAEIDSASVCTRLDLVKLAAQATALERLRISGCQAAVHAGLGAFGDGLAALELADLVLDGVTVGNLSRLGALRSLTLTRVEAGPDPLQPLKAIPLRRLILRDLQTDSEVALMLDLWPKSLMHVVLEGRWARHKAMLTLGRAEGLEVLELRNTDVGNFSLNQIKLLLRLRDITFEGSTFNDRTPLYFRELPVQRFSCTCERLGDLGMRVLRHSQGIEHLELRDTQVTGQGLESIEELAHLKSLVLLDRDIGEEGFKHLAMLSKLEQLELSGELADPKMTGLGALTHLVTLKLSHPTLGARIAPQLESLTELRQLDLGGTSMTDEGLQALAKLPSLRVVQLDRTQVTNRGLEHLAHLGSLEELNLHGTDVVDEGVAHLIGLQNLKSLRLDRTLITDASIDTLVELEALTRLNLAHTVVSAEGVARLRSLPNLEVLELEGIRG